MDREKYISLKFVCFELTIACVRVVCWWMLWFYKLEFNSQILLENQNVETKCHPIIMLRLTSMPFQKIIHFSFEVRRRLFGFFFNLLLTRWCLTSLVTLLQIPSQSYWRTSNGEWSSPRGEERFEWLDVSGTQETTSNSHLGW